MQLVRIGFLIKNFKTILFVFAVLVSNSSCVYAKDFFHVYVEFASDELDTEQTEYIIRDSFVELMNPNRFLKRIYCDAPNGSWKLNVCEMTIADDSFIKDGIYKIYGQVSLESRKHGEALHPSGKRVPYSIRVTFAEHDSNGNSFSGRLTPVNYVNPNGPLGNFMTSFSMK